MKTVTLYGYPMTLKEAKEYLRRLRREYNKHKDKEQFMFDNQVILTKFAKYVIEYLESETKSE